MSGLGRLFVVSGPSGAGKSTIIDVILQKRPELSYSISFTTRLPRGKEKEGKEYYFVSEDVFQKMIDAGELVEWAEVHGYFYGTSAAFIERKIASGKDVLLDIDVEGAKKLLSRYPNAVSVFVAPPDLKTLEGRLSGRATDAQEVIRRRLENAKKEMTHADQYKHVLINQNVDEAISELECIIDEERLL